MVVSPVGKTLLHISHPTHQGASENATQNVLLSKQKNQAKQYQHGHTPVENPSVVHLHPHGSAKLVYCGFLGSTRLCARVALYNRLFHEPTMFLEDSLQNLTLIFLPGLNANR